MKILSKLSNFLLRNNTGLGKDLFGHIERFVVGKQTSSKGVAVLKPYVGGSKRAPNSVFQNGTITNNETITQIENIVNNIGNTIIDNKYVEIKALTNVKYQITTNMLFYVH